MTHTKDYMYTKIKIILVHYLEFVGHINTFGYLQGFKIPVLIIIKINNVYYLLL